MLKAHAARLMEAMSMRPAALWRQLLLSGLVWLGFSSGSAGSDTSAKCLLARPVRNAYASSLRVASARRGKAVAAWCEGMYGGRVMRIMNLHPVAGWRCERPESPGSWDEGEARTAVNSTGAAVVVWIRSKNRFREVVAAAYHPRSGWGTTALLDGSGGGFSPQVTLDEEGNAIVVWNREEPHAEGHGLMTARYTPCGWTAASVLHRNATSPVPSLSGNGFGETVVMWTGLSPHGGRRHQVYAVSFHPRSGWGETAEVGDAVMEIEEMVADETTALPGVYQPVVALDEAGDAVAVWQEVTQERGPSRLMVSRFEARRGWERPQLLAEDALDYSLAVGSGRTPHVCWTQGVSASYATSYVSSLSVATFVPEQGWVAEKVLPCHPYLCRNLVVTLSQAGVLVTWLNWDGADAQVWSVRSTSSGWGEAAALPGAARVTDYQVTAGDQRGALVALTEEGLDGAPAVKVLQVEL